MNLRLLVNIESEKSHSGGSKRIEMRNRYSIRELWYKESLAEIHG